MQHSYNFDLVLGQAELLKQDSDLTTDARWAENESPESCLALSMRARETVERLTKDLTDLQPLPVEGEEVPDVLGRVQDPEVSIRRLHRFARLVGTWECGKVLISVYDNLIEVGLTVDAERLNSCNPSESLARLLTCLESATRFNFLDQEGRRALEPASAASLLLERHHKGLLALRGATRRSRRLQALAAPSAIFMTIVVAALALLIVRGAVEHGSLVLRTDPDREAVFVTTALTPPASGFSMLPSYTLEGQILDTGERARLPVSRDVYIRAAPGARHTVLHTSDPATPFVLRSTFNPDEAVLRVGDHGVAWFAVGALLPVGLWAVLVLYPWLQVRGERRAEMKEQMTRNLLTIAKLTLLLGVIAAIKRLA
jgi:hypothetical protein